MASMKRRKLWKMGEDGLCCSSSAIQTQLGPLSLLEERSKTPLFLLFFCVVGYPPNWGKQPRYIDRIDRSLPARENPIKDRSITFNWRNHQLQFLLKVQKELSYLLYSGLGWIYFPSMTPMKELRPLPLVEAGCGSPDIYQDAFCNFLRKACLTDKSLNNFHETEEIQSLRKFLDMRLNQQIPQQREL